MGKTYLEANKKIKMYLAAKFMKGMYLGGLRVYPNAEMVTYYVDTNTIYTEEVDIDDSCLSPKTFTPTKSGWTFRGWREDKTASSSVLSNKVMTGENVTLYAVFQQTITLSYNGNGATSGSTSSQTGTRYYNNGNTANPSFTLRSNGYSKTYYSFNKWAMGSTSGTQYSAGASVTLSANTTFYAIWTSNYSKAVASIGGSGMAYYAQGWIVIPSNYTYNADASGAVSSGPSISGNAISWYGSNAGHIKANCPCSVTVSGSLTVTDIDGGSTPQVYIYKNDTKDTQLAYVWLNNTDSKVDNEKSYTINKTFSLNTGDRLSLRGLFGWDGNSSHRSGWYVSVTFTATPTI